MTLGRMSLVACILLSSSNTHAFECPRFKADGVYDFTGAEFRLTFIKCAFASLIDQKRNIRYNFKLDGKTRSTLPKSFYMQSQRRLENGTAVNWNPLRPIAKLEKATYVSSLRLDDDGSAIHLNIRAVASVREAKTNSRPLRVHLEGHAAVYLHERRRKNDCVNCSKQDPLLERKSYLTVWLGNIEIKKVEGGSVNEAESLLFKALENDPVYSVFIDYEDRIAQWPRNLNDLILLRSFRRLAE